MIALEASRSKGLKKNQTTCLTTGAASVNEGGSVVFTLQTANVPAGTKYAYVLSGVSAADIDGGQLTGEVTIGADGKAYISTNLTADNLTEGAETLTLTTAGKTVSVTVNDTSTTPAPVVVVPTYALSSGAASVNEGGTAVFTLDTTNVASGSKVGYVLSGVSSADVEGGQLTGEATVGADGKAYISVNLAADATTEGAETLTVTAAGKTASVVVADTSTTPVAVVPTYTLAATSSTVAEGETMLFELATTGVAAGTKITYKITGTGSASGLTGSGVAEVDSTGTALITLTSSANSVIGDAGAVKVELLNGKAAAVTTSVADATSTTYGADAISVANAANAPLTITVTGTAPQTITLGTDQITATSGFVINASSTAVTVSAGAGNDRITVNGNANNTISTGAGNDTVIVSGSGANTINVGTGTDTVTGGSGNDRIIIGTGDLTAADRINSGAGFDTLVVSGEGNVIDATNVVGVEDLVLDGTVVQITAAAISGLRSISGHASTSVVTISDNNPTIDLTAKNVQITGLKEIIVAGTAKIIASAEQIAQIGSFTHAGALTIQTSVEGLKALGNKAIGAGTLTKEVVDTVDNIVANKDSLTGVTLVVSGNITGADALALANAGIASSKTVSMSVTELLEAVQYPDQKAALTAANTKIAVTDTATVAQAATLITNYGTQIAAYQAAATGNKGIAISDTPANVAAAYNTTAAAATVSSIALASGAALNVANATNLITLSNKMTGSFSVTDSAAAVIGASTGVKTAASSISLTTAGRSVSTTADALSLKALGSKLAGGYDIALITTTALTTDGLSSIAGATKATLTGTVSVSQLNQILASNSAATVTVLQDNAQNLVTASSKLSAVTLDLKIEGVVTVNQASVISPALTAILAKTGSHTGYGVSGSVYTNGYVISDVSSAVLDASNATAVKGAKAVTVTNAMTLADATSLKTLADVSGDTLDFANVTYNVTDSAAALATALSNTTAATQQKTVDVLGKATTVTATGTATVAQAKVLGTAATPTGGSSGVQVDSWAVSDTVAHLFSSGATLASDVTTAKANATSLSVQGAVTVAQMDALQDVKNGANTAVFDNVYSIVDGAAAIAAKASTIAITGTANSGATSLTVTSATGLTVGAVISGTGIASGTKITAISGTTLTLSAATTAAISTGALTATAIAELTAASSVSANTAAAVSDLGGLAALNAALTTAGKAQVAYALTDTYDHLMGTGVGLNSATPSIVTAAKAASLITVTGNFLSSADASTITAARLLDLSAAAGTATYTVNVTATEAEIAAQQAGVLNNSVISKITIASPIAIVGTNGSAVDGAAELLAAIGQSVMNKVSYSVSDTVANLLDPQYRDLVLAADNVTATDSSVTAVQAQQLLALTGAKGTVTYTLGDTYAAVAANAAAAAVAAAIDVSNTSLTVAQYANLLSIAGENTTVSSEAITDTAAAVSAASTKVLAATSGVTLTDVGTLNLNAAQAVALVNSGNTAYKLASSSAQPAGATVVVNVNDTAANLLALKADAVSTSATKDASARVISASTVIKASDVAVLSGANAHTLLSFASGSGFALSDTAANLANSSVISTSELGKASAVTVTGTSALADAATVAQYATGTLTVSEISESSVGTSSSGLIKSTGTGSNLVYTYASLFAKTAKITLSSAGSVDDVTKLKAAAGTTSVSYSLSDTASNLNGTDGKALLSASTAVTVDTSSTPATVAQAVYLNQFDSKITADYKVAGTAADLIANLAAVQNAAGTTADVSVSSGNLSVSQYTTLRATFGARLAGNGVDGSSNPIYVVTDSASAIANYLAAGNTLATISTYPGAFTLTSDVTVTAAQAVTLQGASITAVKVVDTAANVLAASTLSGQTSYEVTDTVSLGVAGQLYTAHSGVIIDSISTTASTFATAYTYNSNVGVAAHKGALLNAKSITVDGVAVTLGVKDASLTANARTTYNGKIVGTVDEINALPASIKTAAGYVVIDSLANITAAANTAVIAAGSGYVVKDNAANITAAGTSVLQTASGALGIEVDGAISVATLNTILANTNTDLYVKYSLADSAANLVSGSSAVAGVSAATAVTVSSTATKAQADALFTANTKTTVHVVDTGANIAASSNIGKFASIVADADLNTAGIQGITASYANTIVRNKAASATLTMNVDDSAANLSTAIANTSGTGADASTLAAAGSITVTGGTTTAATAAQAKNLAKVTISGGYAVSGTASELTTSATVGLSDLAKATVVKVTSGSSGTATVAQANTLLSLSNIEKGTGADAALANFAIADTAKALAGADASKLDSVIGTVTVSSFTDALTAAEATNLAAVDAASTKLTVDWSNGSSAGIAVKDDAQALLANSAAVTKAELIEIKDAVSIATFNQVKSIDALDSSTNTTGGYTYKLVDSAAALIVAGTAAVDGATSVKVTGSTSVADLTLIDTRAANSSTVTTVVTYDKVVGTEAQLFGSSGGTTLNTSVAANATVISLTGSASVAQAKALKADSNFDNTYAIADTAANIVGAINGADKAVLNSATSVGLATGQTATVSQARVINAQLGNETGLALADLAANYNATAAASVVSAAASLSVTGSTSNDDVTNGTTAKVTLLVGALTNLAATTQTGSAPTTGLDVLHLKSGDVISFSGITDFNTTSVNATDGYLQLNANSTVDGGEYQVTRGYYGADGSFYASSSGTDTLIELGTNDTAGADRVIVLVGTTSLTTLNVDGNAAHVTGFTAA